VHYDPILLQIVGATLVILVVTLASRVLHQSHVMGYILAGLVLGPGGLEFFREYELVMRLGDLGVVLLLFFVGMETSPHRLLANWRVTVLGTSLQIAGSVLLAALIGAWLGWPLGRIVLIGFVISLSSTAVVLNYLRETRQLRTKIGQDTLHILLAQDLALIPMLLAVGLLAGGPLDAGTLALQGVGAALALALLAWLTFGGHVRLPLLRRLRQDHELQVFTAFGLCLGFSLLSSLFQLSAALGAFLAGMLVGVARETNWVRHRLEPFRVLFVAVFFVSIGLLVNVPFVLQHAGLIVGLTLAVFVGNTLVNALIFRMLGEPWRYSIYASAHLAQIGEFSFVLAAVGEKGRLLSEFNYQLVIAVIALTLLLSPAWIALVGRGQRRDPPPRVAEKSAP